MPLFAWMSTPLHNIAAKFSWVIRQIIHGYMRRNVDTLNLQRGGWVLWKFLGGDVPLGPWNT